MQRLNPTPKEIQFSREVAYYEPDAPDSTPPVIVLPENPAPAERTAARLLEKSLNTALARVRPAGNAPALRAKIVERDLNASELQDARLIFSIGKNSLTRRLSPDLPLASISGREQGQTMMPVRPS